MHLIMRHINPHCNNRKLKTYPEKNLFQCKILMKFLLKVMLKLEMIIANFEIIKLMMNKMNSMILQVIFKNIFGS